MEIHRQTCQACGSRELKNILVREREHPQQVYVQCASCGAFVARYVLSDYYHHGKGIESYLRTHGLNVHESGREWKWQFEEAQKESTDGFDRAMEQVELKYGNEKPKPEN